MITLLTTSSAPGPAAPRCVRSMFKLQRGVVEILRHVDILNAADSLRICVADLCGDIVGASSCCCPLTWMSMGAGRPRLRTASTKPPDWK